MRFYIADAALISNLGHHANAAKYIVDVVRDQGIEVRTFGHIDLEPELQQSLNAVPHFRIYTYGSTNLDRYCGWLTSFHDIASRTFEDLANIAGIERDDIFFFHGAQPPQVMAMIQWATTLPEESCPMMIVELGGDPGVTIASDGSGRIVDVPNPQVDARATLFRFAAHQMKALEGRPFHIITYDATISAVYGNLMMCPVGVLPFPTPAILPLRNRGGATPVTISCLGHQQYMKGFHLLPEIVKQVLKQEKNVRFHIHNSDPATKASAGSSAMREAAFLLARMAERDARITLDERAVGFEEWKQLLEATDLILCPYDPHRYATGHSGLASAALANGIPLIAPAKTSLSNWLDEFGHPGVTFEAFEPKSIIAAVRLALKRFDDIAQRAVDAAHRWIHTHGPANCVAQILEMNRRRLAGRAPTPIVAPRDQARTVPSSPAPRREPANARVAPASRVRTAPPGRPVAPVDILEKRTARDHKVAGVELAASGNILGAISEFDTALQKLPTFAEAWVCRGKALEELHRPGEAYEAYAQALIHAPLYEEAQDRLAALASILRRPAAVLTPWVADPAPAKMAQLHHKAALLVGRREEFQYRYRDRDEGALRVRLLENPRSSADATALGRVLSAQGRFVEAELFFKYALRLEPWNGEAAVRLCVTLDTQPAKAPEQINVVKAALSAGATDDRLIPMALWAQADIAQWADYEHLRDQAMAAFARTPSAVAPFSMLHYSADLELHKRCAAAYFEKTVGRAARKPRPGGRHDGQPLTVGYLSADFRHHAVAHLCAEIFELHDRRRVRSVGLATFTGVQAQIGPRVRGSFDKFVDLAGLSHEAAVQKISEAKVDILVDLTGYTGHAQPEILAAKLAPIQVNFLGYPGTLGTDAVDYIISDKIVAPTEHAQWYAECLVHMPNSYQVNDRKRPKGDKKFSRAQAGLPEIGTVFACFNEMRKVNPSVFRIWMRILKRVPGSVLWLYAANPLAAENLRREVVNAGLDPARLVVAGNVKHEEHLARYRLADLVLDTQPYGAHTTASDALWIGCPVITLLGEAFAGRVGASLLTAVGMPELITKSWSEYEELAVRLGTDAAAREELRRKLQRIGPSSRLFDSPRFTRQLEWAYSEMWRRYSNGEGPQPLEVPDI